MIWRHVKSTKKALRKLPVSAKAVLISKDGKVLVLRKDSGLADLPGGKVEKDEDLYEALQREIEEEVQFSPKKYKFITSWVKHNPLLGDRLVLVFEARLKRKAENLKIKLSDEHTWGQFLDAEGVNEVDGLAPGYINALQICLSRHESR